MLDIKNNLIMKKFLYIICVFFIVNTLVNAEDLCLSTMSGNINLPFLPEVTTMSDSVPPFWVDIVTSLPEGYIVDDQGNVEISTAEGLAWFISEVNGLNGCEPDNFKGRTVVLTNDINLSDSDIGVRRFTPIGNRNNPFMGIFDGCNHKIDGINILYRHHYGDSAVFDIGMFGYICNGTIKNVILNSGTLFVNDFLDEIYQYPQGSLVSFSDSLSVIDNCIVKLDLGFINGGAVVGVNRNSIIRNCSYNFGGNVDFGINGAGIVYLNLSEGGYANSEVLNCYFYGGLIGSYSVENQGGIVCFNETATNNNGKSAIIRNCHAKLLKDMYGFDYVGGIAGYNSEGSIMENCYADITSVEHDITLIGKNDGIFNNCSEYVVEDDHCLLLDYVYVGEHKTNSLLDALNIWVDIQDDPEIYQIWEIKNNGIPEFEGFYPSGITIENSNFDNIVIYPNPSKDFINIKGLNGESTMSYSIYDMTGRLVLQGYISQNSEISISSLKDGIYVISIDVEKPIKSKFVKQR